MAYLLGIDGGGSKTTAWISDENLRVIGKAEAGPSNAVKTGIAAAGNEILRAVCKARRNARIGGAEFDAVCAGLAGAGNGQIHRRMAKWLRESIPARSALLTTDAAIALAAAGYACGIIVISGTGSIACGRDEHGNLARAGGWGSVFDDPGSGYDIGRKAIAGVLREMDGRGGKTGLMRPITRALGVKDPTLIGANPPPPQDIAAIFSVVQREAQTGNRFARQLCSEAGRDLAELALALIRRFGWQRRAANVICAGGVFRASATIRRSFTRQLHATAPKARVSLLEREPVEGALRLARDLL